MNAIHPNYICNLLVFDWFFVELTLMSRISKGHPQYFRVLVIKGLNAFNEASEDFFYQTFSVFSPCFVTAKSGKLWPEAWFKKKKKKEKKNSELAKNSILKQAFT